MGYGFHYFKGEHLTRDILVIKKVLEKIRHLDWEDDKIDVSRDWVSIHFFTVSQLARLLALRRGHDGELAAVAGVLHDIGLLDLGGMEHSHAVSGKSLINEILEDVGRFSSEEIELITNAAIRHSEKDKVGTWLDEVIKDTDVLDCTMFGSDFSPFEYHYKRYLNVKNEFGL